MKPPVTDQVSSSINSQRSSIPQKGSTRFEIWRQFSHLNKGSLLRDQSYDAAVLGAPGKAVETPQVQGPCKPLGHVPEGTVVRGCCAVCWIEVFNPNVVRNFLSLFNKKMSMLDWKQHPSCVTPNILQSLGKKLGKLVTVLLLERFGLG